MKSFYAGSAEIGAERLCILAGPCVIEGEEMCFEVASRLKAACEARVQVLINRVVWCLYRLMP
ncbi:MAG: hypothetical protein ACM31G_08535 [Flavobacteriales bacterium]